MELRVPIIVENHCSYPLHPSDGYAGEASIRRQHKLPPDTPICVIPHWYAFKPGEWWWCTRCGRRDKQRVALIHNMKDPLEVWGRPWRMPYCPPRELAKLLAHFGAARQKLGGRFVTLQAQTRFANRHAPDGLAWCPWGLHYRANGDHPAIQDRGRRSWCLACYARWAQLYKIFLLQRTRKAYKKEMQTVTAMQHQRHALRQEVAELRRIRAVLLQEMATTTQPDTAETLYENDSQRGDDVQSWEATERRQPAQIRVIHRQRRKAYSV